MWLFVPGTVGNTGIDESLQVTVHPTNLYGNVIGSCVGSYEDIKPLPFQITDPPATILE